MEIIFNEITNNKKSNIQSDFIRDILNIISAGYHVALIKKPKEFTEETKMFETFKIQGGLFSILRLEKNDTLYYLLVSIKSLKIKNNVDLLEYAKLLEILPLTAIIFYFSRAVLFHNMIVWWVGGAVFLFPKN